MRLKSFKAKGFVLKRINIGEADRLVTLLTPDQGKIQVLAKGVRRTKSRRAPHLELFNFVNVVLHQGTQWPIVTEATEGVTSLGARNSLMLTTYLFYIAEVIDRLLPENEPHPEAYFLVDDFLTEALAKSSSDDDYQQIAKEVVLRLLWDLGYLPRGSFPPEGISTFVEGIIERPLKTKAFLEKI